MPTKDPDKLREKNRLKAKRRRERAKTDPELREKILSKKRAYYQRYKERERAKARSRSTPVSPDEKARRKRVRQSKNPIKDSHVKAYRVHVRHIKSSLHDSHVRAYKKSGRYQYQVYRKGCPKYKCKKFIYKSLSRVLSSKDSESETLIGYSKHDLVKHIENQFSDGMSWENYGDWHIDHVIPIKHYLDSGVDCPKVINSLSNLQPMWAEENSRKGCRYEHP